MNQTFNKKKIVIGFEEKFLIMALKRRRRQLDLGTPPYAAPKKS